MDWRHLLALTLVTFAYLIIGMFLFRAIELDSEIETRTRLVNEFSAFLGRHPCVNLSHVSGLLHSIRQEELRMAQLAADNSSSFEPRWEYSGSFSFVVTLVTTIGYGHMAPGTEAGKVVSVVYALVGIPLMLLVLKAIGKKLGTASRRMTALKCFRSQRVNHAVRQLLPLALGLGLVMVLPAGLMHYVEGWNLVESFYFCFITLSTVGFGDYLPTGQYLTTATQRHLYRVFLYVWVIFGLAYVSLVINIISDTLVEQATSMEKQAVSKLESELRRLRAEMSTPSRYSPQSEPSPRDACPAHSQQRTSDDVTLRRYSSRRESDEFEIAPEYNFERKPEAPVDLPVCDCNVKDMNS